MNLREMKVAAAVAAIGLAVTGWAVQVAAQDAQGLYSKEQAERGSALFTANCAQCHGAQLQGAEAPALIGRDVMGTWITAQGIFDYVSVAMPPSSPGQLGESVYVDILSHILAMNGAPAGSKPMALADLPNVDLVKATGVAAAPAAAPATPATAAAPRLPQAFTAGRVLPTVGADGVVPPPAAAAAPPAPKLPQAFTAGRQLPTVAPSSAPLPLPGPAQ